MVSLRRDRPRKLTGYRITSAGCGQSLWLGHRQPGSRNGNYFSIAHFICFPRSIMRQLYMQRTFHLERSCQCTTHFLTPSHACVYFAHTALYRGCAERRSHWFAPGSEATPPECSLRRMRSTWAVQLLTILNLQWTQKQIQLWQSL